MDLTPFAHTAPAAFMKEAVRTPDPSPKWCRQGLYFWHGGSLKRPQGPQDRHSCCEPSDSQLALCPVSGQPQMPALCVHDGTLVNATGHGLNLFCFITMKYLEIWCLSHF